MKADLVACRQTGQAVADYFGKVKVIWDDLDEYEPLLSCCCDKPNCPHMLKHIQRRDHEKIYQFLMGLDASKFGTTGTNILGWLSRDNDLNLDNIYSDIIAEERHLMVARSKEERIDAVGFAVQSGVNAIALVTRVNNLGLVLTVDVQITVWILVLNSMVFRIGGLINMEILAVNSSPDVVVDAITLVVEAYDVDTRTELTTHRFHLCLSSLTF